MNRKIRVLYICSHKDLGGASQSMLDMVRGLSDAIEPIVLTTEQGELSKECERRGYRCIIHSYVDLACFPKKWKKHWVFKPWKHWIVKYYREDIGCLLFLKKQLRKDDIDIVHSNVSGCTIGVLISRFWNVPHIWHIREALDLHFSTEICLGMKRLKRLINKADARIAISGAIKDHWEMKENGTFVINDAVREKEDVSYIPKKDKYFLFTSFSMTEAKGSLLAIEAFGLSDLQNKDYRLKMLGHCDKWMKEKLLNVANKYNCEEKIDFVPFQKNVKPFYEHACAFLQCSVYEGLGRTTAEAMFYGCPVIATAYSGGTLDLIKNRKTGYLFSNPTECAELLKEVAENKQEDIILNAQKFAMDNLTPSVYGPKLLKVYNSVLEL